jgi:filamentous hemagglutinin
MTLVGAAPELVLAARLAIAGCKTNPALCLNQAGIFAADIVAPEAIIGTGAVTTGSTLILGTTEDSVKKLTQQLVKTSDELYKTKTFNAQPVADFIKGETAAGANLSTKTANYLRDIQKSNTDQLVKLFDKTEADGKVNVFGKSIQQVLGDGGSNKKGTTKVFASETLTDKEIYDYAQSLTGGLPLKEVRNYSSSAQESKARWTIDIIRNKNINTISKLSDNKFEIKFR